MNFNNILDFYWIWFCILVLPMAVISGIPGSAHLCREHWKSPTGYLKLTSVSHTAVKYVHFTLAAAILDFWRVLTSCDTGSCTIETLDTENMGIAVEILLLCALEFEICLGVKIPPICRRTSPKKTVTGVWDKGETDKNKVLKAQ